MLRDLRLSAPLEPTTTEVASLPVGAGVMPHKLGQHRSELRTFVRIQWRERHVLHRGERELEVEQPVPSSAGEADDVPAPVARVGSAFDEVPIDECVDDGHHVAAIQTASASQIDLAGRPVLVERGEHSVMVSASIGGVEAVEHDAVDVKRGLAQQEAGEMLESGRTGRGIDGGHATESTFGDAWDESSMRRVPVTVRGGR